MVTERTEVRVQCRQEEKWVETRSDVTAAGDVRCGWTAMWEVLTPDLHLTVNGTSISIHGISQYRRDSNKGLPS